MTRLLVWAFAAAIALISASRINAADKPFRQRQSGPPGAQSAEALSNADILAMVKAGLPDSIIVTKVQTAPSARLDTSTRGLIALKEGGASTTVLDAVMKRADGPATAGAGQPAAGSLPTPSPAPPTPTAPAAGPPSGTVALFSGSRWAKLEPVIGVPRKKLLAHYVDFAGRTALVRGTASGLRFQVRSTADVRGTYHLVRLEVQEEKGNRTFKYTGKERAPDEDFAVPVDVQKSGEGTWVIAPSGSLAPGEYGLFTSRAADRPGAPESLVLYEFGLGNTAATSEPSLSGSGPAAADASGSTAEAACQANFKTEGGYWKGQSFVTSFTVPRQAENTAFETLLQSLAESQANWQITASSKDAGLISATEEMAEIMGDKMLKANLKIVLKKDASGGAQRVDMNFIVPSGTKAPEKGVRTVFCTQIAAKLDGTRR